MKETTPTFLEEITLSMKLSIWSKSSCGKFLPLGKKSREEKKWDESEAKILVYVLQQLELKPTTSVQNYVHVALLHFPHFNQVYSTEMPLLIKICILRPWKTQK